MGLIKESVSELEKKVKYARIAMRFLKELKLVKYFIDYTKTPEYQKYLKGSIIAQENTSYIWYDRTCCASVFGVCDFDSYMKKVDIQYSFSIFELFIAFLIIFYPEEYDESRRHYNLKESIITMDILLTETPKDDFKYRLIKYNENNVNIILNWLKYKYFTL